MTDIEIVARAPVGDTGKSVLPGPRRHAALADHGVPLRAQQRAADARGGEGPRRVRPAGRAHGAARQAPALVARPPLRCRRIPDAGRGVGPRGRGVRRADPRDRHPHCTVSRGRVHAPARTTLVVDVGAGAVDRARALPVSGDTNRWLLAGPVVGLAIVLCLLFGIATHGPARAAYLGVAAGMCFGTSAVLTKR